MFCSLFTWEQKLQGFHLDQPSLPLPLVGAQTVHPAASGSQGLHGTSFVDIPPVNITSNWLNWAILLAEPSPPAYLTSSWLNWAILLPEPLTPVNLTSWRLNWTISITWTSSP